MRCGSYSTHIFHPRTGLQMGSCPRSAPTAVGTSLPSISGHGGEGGIAVNDDGTRFASVDSDQHCVYIYSLDGAGERTAAPVVFGTVGTHGSEQGQLRDPKFTCFVRRNGIDTLLICDYGNGRVVEITVTGVFLRAIAMKNGGRPWGVSYCGSSDFIAVSLYLDHAVVLLQYASATVMATLPVGSSGSARGSDDGQLYSPQGLRFAADGTQILLADSVNHRVSLFSVASGKFLAHTATGAANGTRRPSDVLQCGDGSRVVAEGEAHGSVVCVGVDGVTVQQIVAGEDDFIPHSLAYSPLLRGVLVKERGSGGRVMLLK
jgi:DNA-binding beta-propeller fold protein YncE